jgi:aminoglycoside phosphotransferase family enzyme/predicted kinase
LSAAGDVRAWLAGRSARVIETSCAQVFLAGEVAFKIKRPVDFGFLDFTTLEARRWAVERELAFNSGSAPDIYRAVRSITRRPDGGFDFDGAGEVVEYALEMRRFDEDAVLSAQPGALDGELADALGRAVARAHAAAPVRFAAEGIVYPIRSNAALLRELAPRLGPDSVEALIAATDDELARRSPLLDARLATGFVRRCHGDLHLGNILLEAGRPVLFDCIEFNDALSDIDVLYDLAFLLMDLDFRGQRNAAVRVQSAWLDAAARTMPPQLWDGLAALPLMMSVRAAVRAHVSAHGGDMDASKAYLAAAIDHLSPAPPALLAVGGRSGSGKSVFARRAAARIGPAPGAVILRTDEIRKRLVGAAASEPLAPSAYAPAVTRRTYDALFEFAQVLLGAGRSVVLDATFLDAGLRKRAADLARGSGVSLQGIWLEAPQAVLTTRVVGRRGDASDATVETLRGQLARDPGQMDGWMTLDASGPPETVVETWARVAQGLRPL